MFINPNEAQEIEKSITFLVNEYNKTGHNPKPVILHSLNVAFYLLRYGYNKNIIIAAVLHDLVEDSAVDLSMIENEFGSKIAGLVGAVSYDPAISDKEEKYQEMFGRIIKQGKEAAIIKCADIYNNSFYIDLVENEALKKQLIVKIKYFLDLSQPLIGQEPVWVDLNKQYQEQKYH